MRKVLFINASILIIILLSVLFIVNSSMVPKKEFNKISQELSLLKTEYQELDSLNKGYIDEINSSMVPEKEFAEMSRELDLLEIEYHKLDLLNKEYTGEINNLLAENEKMKAELKHKNLLQDNILGILSKNDYICIIDRRLDVKLVDMLFRHFKAIEDGDMQAYLSTTTNSDYALEMFEHEKYISHEIYAIYPADDYKQEHLDEGGYFLVVATSSVERGIDGYFIGVNKVAGEWNVYDYD